MTGSPALPGAIGLSRLRVYPWATDDGLHGGTPHLHLTCTECYLVIAGAGELHTLTLGGFARTPLQPGDAVWFTPGTIHRAVNLDGALQVQVLMQNDGLPEAGDAVLTLPPDYLADTGRYRETVALGDGDDLARQDRARRRRDLAIEGFMTLRDRVDDGDPGALRQFYAAAGALVGDRLDDWERIWTDSAAAAARRTGEQIAALRAGDVSHLGDAAVASLRPERDDVLGMCGFLAAYK